MTAGLTIVFLFLWLGRYQPATKYARTYAVTTPVIAEVSGRVIEVVSEGGQLPSPTRQSAIRSPPS